MDKQTALIRHATFYQQDLQSPLKLGQLGMSIDECRVFIGLPSTDVPASLVAGRTTSNPYGCGGENVEVLTEFTPPSVLNRVLNKPITIYVTPGNNKYTILTTSRTFMEYIAYPDKETYASSSESLNFESGTISIVAIGGTPMFTQSSSTNNSTGLSNLRISSPEYDEDTGMLTFYMANTYTTAYVMEILVRGWNGQIIHSTTGE